MVGIGVESGADGRTFGLQAEPGSTGRGWIWPQVYLSRAGVLDPSPTIRIHPEDSTYVLPCGKRISSSSCGFGRSPGT